MYEHLCCCRCISSILLLFESRGSNRAKSESAVLHVPAKNENERIKVRTFERVALLAGANLFSGGKYHRSFAGATRTGTGALGALPCFNLTRTKQGLISA